MDDESYWQWLAQWQEDTQSLAFVIPGYRGAWQPLLLPIPRYVERRRDEPHSLALIVK